MIVLYLTIHMYGLVQNKTNVWQEYMLIKNINPQLCKNCVILFIQKWKKYDKHNPTLSLRIPDLSYLSVQLYL